MSLSESSHCSSPSSDDSDSVSSKDTTNDEQPNEPQMKTEVEIAIGFLTHLVKQHFGAEMATRFASELAPRLYEHYQDHWFPSQPYKGMAYRCLRINGKMDPLIHTAGRKAGLKTGQLRRAFPVELTMWVDPGEVSYRIGEEGSVCELFQTPETLAYSRQRPITPPKNKQVTGHNRSKQQHSNHCPPIISASPPGSRHFTAPNRNPQVPMTTVQLSSPTLAGSSPPTTEGSYMVGGGHNNFHHSNSFSTTNAMFNHHHPQQHHQTTLTDHSGRPLSYETNTRHGFYNHQQQPHHQRPVFYGGISSGNSGSDVAHPQRQSGGSANLSEEQAFEAASTMVQDIIKFLEQRDSGAAQAACYKDNFERLVKCAIPCVAGAGQA